MLRKLTTLFKRQPVKQPTPMDKITEAITTINNNMPLLEKGHQLWVEREDGVVTLTLCVWKSRAPERVFP